MKIAVLADIHSNHVALETCLSYAKEHEIHKFIFLGDYIGDLACPQKTMQLLYELNDKYNCVFIRGNKENYWINHRKSKEVWEDGNSVTGTMYYAYSQLMDRDIDFFEQMPVAGRVDLKKMKLTELKARDASCPLGQEDAVNKHVLEQVQEPSRAKRDRSITICHGSPRKVNETMRPDVADPYELVKEIDTALTLCAHYHIQTRYEKNGKTIINPGSVGVPLFAFSGDVAPVLGRQYPKEHMSKTQFLILEEKEAGWLPEFISLDYDVEQAIAEMHEEKLDIHAPGWCSITEHLLRAGDGSHAVVLNKAMELCEQDTGTCIWPDIPEKYWTRALQELA